MLHGELTEPSPLTGASDAAALIDERLYFEAARRRTLWSKMRREPLALACLAFILLVCVAALLAPWIAPHDPNFGYDAGLDANGAPVGSSAQFLLGTDTTGRDVLSRLLYGSRVSLTVGVLATALTVVLGVVIGAVSGYFGGWAEIIMTRLVDIMLAFPVVLLGLAAAAVFAPSLTTAIVVIAATQWMYMARVVYTQVQTLKELEFVQAARSVGLSETRILVRHITPHLLPLVIAYSSLGIGISILLEATLSYLNAGVPAPTASWGSMIAGGFTSYREDPALVLYPGIVLTLVVLAFTLLGDGLTRALGGR
jgi:ABC-type dipeptide/oligopeptide/nickel transport system permease subunit